MRVLPASVLLLIWFAAPSAHGAPAAALQAQASDWGRLHGAGIYCRRQDVHDFGVTVTRYFKAKTKSRADYDALVETYGLTMLNSAQKPPSGAAGSSCDEFGRRYREAWDYLQGQLGE